MKNHEGCTCEFVGLARIKSQIPPLDDGNVYSAQVWKNNEGITYLRVYAYPDMKDTYVRLSMDAVDLINS